ncbi:arsenic resistance N-acetyltransferase ArsN2 [Larkinella terrae]|uniref:GNAT family N-acetyltransferase n=1 Tax=Larkinella terrae TaxID=2025311 RepID=A0A7K0ER59_9BACT|nr:arsenic resistance N-acetyltransferase ArsN2 [Larkinella terrae]MRS64041.1 GNAT family N-acetyltransferase [Larkinella terrae]
MAVWIETARSENREALLFLLEQAHLLTDDLPPELSDFIIAKNSDAIIGIAGLERFGSVALLRSVAVDPQHQGKRIGQQLVNRLLETAQATGLTDVYLMTTGAGAYFERYGFQSVDRQSVPMVIQRTRQFSELCPSSAVVMKKMLKSNDV